MKKIIWIVLIFSTIMLSSSIYAGDSGTNATSTVNTTSNAVIYNQPGGNSEISRSFIQAIPGVTNSIIPGNSGGFTERKQVVPFRRQVPMAQVKSILSIKTAIGAVGDKLSFWKWLGHEEDRINSISYVKTTKGSDDLISIIDWDPQEGGYPDDKILGETTVHGLAWWSYRRFEAEGINRCREKVSKDTKRVAIFMRNFFPTINKSNQKGIGVAGSAVNKSNDFSPAVSIGFANAKQSSSTEIVPYYDLTCMNDGPISMYVEKIKKDDDNSNNKVGKDSGPKKLISPADDSSLISFLKKMNEEQAKTIENFSKPRDINVNMPTAVNLSPLAPEKPMSASINMEDRCSGMPDWEVYFPYGYPEDPRIHPSAPQGIDFAYWAKIVPDQKEKTEKMLGWFKSHQNCSVQAETHTDTSGGKTYNAGLGERRAKAIYDFWLSQGIKLVLYESSGKNFPVSFIPSSDKNRENRRGYLIVKATASGK